MASSLVHLADSRLTNQILLWTTARCPPAASRKQLYWRNRSCPTGQGATAMMNGNHCTVQVWPLKDGSGGTRFPGRVYAGGSNRRWWLSDSSPSFGPGDSDPYGPYPWEEGDSKASEEARGLGAEKAHLEWVQEPEITLLTSEGAVKIGGNRSRRRVQRPSSSGRALSGRSGGVRFREEDFMDANQQLCLGALFDIAATNGLDSGRRFCVVGFCRSIEMLCTVVEDSVREQGGEIVVLEKNSSEGLHEKLHLTVALPLLWGVPPALDTLHYAIRTGGGIVDRMYNRWEFFG
eukprot:TRINITY_DN3497_c1_g2_i1.p1 TRINITY_DN3497_c1_g2~~TRINITY_DN3497_c1_g2_i1.p1  ORF type:complete len:291 (+),score=47.43 TRINITY_DN3497_c1_g2_i1:273-1145(+)